MDTVTFYNSILPPLGKRVLAAFRNGLKAPPQHIFHDTTAELIASAASLDAQGVNVYHACSTFRTGESRKATNALAAKSLWVDLDVGPTKHYQDIRDAAAAIERFRVDVGLPLTAMLKSGGGLHVYFPFDKSLAPEQWVRLAAVLATCLDHAGVKHDSSRTQDIASILRVPGTSNYKTSEPRAVRLLRLGVEAPAQAIYRALKDYANKNALVVLEPVAGVTRGPAPTNELVGNVTYPPSIGHRVAAACPALHEVESTGGDVEYMVWWAAMGVAKHCEQPDDVAEHWTRNRAATHHEKADWRQLIDNWPTPPTTCETFSKHTDACSGCKFFGKIKSPISLGYEEQPPVQPVAVAPQPSAPVSTSAVPAAPRPTPPSAAPGPWEFGAQWIVDRMCKATKTGYSNNQMTMSVPNEDGATFSHVPLCNRYWQVMRRIKNDEDAWCLEIGYQDYPGMPHKLFLLESSAVTAPDLLRKAFSQRELHINGGQRGMTKTQEILKWEQDALFGYQLETVTHKTMGWMTTDNKRDNPLTGEFILGDTVLSPGKAPRTAALDESIASNLQTAFQTAGTVAQWVDHVDRVYNRQNAQAYQFAIAAAFAAPLVKLVPGEGDWHGIPVVLVGKTGAAKTSTALVAMSLYAKPQALRFNAQGSGGGAQGDTPAAFAAKVGSLCNIPFIADEMTGVDADRMGAVMYMLSSGKAKDRCFPNGQLMPNPHSWDVISLATGNESFHSRLQQIKDSNTQDATRYRCFEVTLQPSDLQTIFPDVSRNFIENDMLAEQYGCAGRKWLQFLVNNREVVASKLNKLRAIYRITDNDTSAIRFYKDLLLTVEIAATLAKACGLIRWDVKAMMDWARAQLVSLDQGVVERDWDSVIAAFVASLFGRTIVTKHFKRGPGRRHAPEAPIEPLVSALHPVARRAIDDKVLAVTKRYMDRWCDDQRVSADGMVLEMHKRGYLQTAAGAAPKARMLNIGSGTTITSAQASCWEIDLNTLQQAGDQGGGEGGGANVVPFTTPKDPTPSGELAEAS